jgi:hypothetical protein
MKNFLYLLVTVLIFFPVSSSAQEKYDFVDLKKNVEKYNDSKNMLELKNGRQYMLDSGVIIEKLNVRNLPVKRNFFDLENAMVIHDTSENEISTECLDMITPFNQIPPSRVEEITEIGCLLYDRENRLSTHDDDLYAFHKKFCKVTK